jgi:hypothetical protein
VLEKSTQKKKVLHACLASGFWLLASGYWRRFVKKEG